MVLRSLALPQQAAASIIPKLIKLDPDQIFYRIHLAEFNPIFFGHKTAAFRFDDPLRRFGVIYCGVVFLAAMVETLLHDCEGRRAEFSRAAINARSVSLMSNKRPLRLLDLRSEGGLSLGLDARIWSSHYEVSQAWARWAYEQKSQIDGILYPSRHSYRYECVALFDRCRKALQLDSSHALSQQPYNAIITRYSRENRFDIIEDEHEQFI